MFDPAGAAELLEQYRRFDADALGEAFSQLGALERATRAQRLLVLSVLDEREAWTVDGATDLVAWVAANDALHRATAAELVEQARALAALPAIAATAAEGRMSPDQLRHLVAIAAPDTDAGGACAWWHDERTGMVRISGRLTPDAGAVVAAVLSRHAEQAGPAPDGLWERFEARCADALVELASAGLADDADHDRACIVVHTTVDGLLPDGTDVATLQDGTPLPVEVARRLSCDAVRQVVVESSDGTLGIGRKARTVPPWLLRLLRQRDVHCRFPGCDRLRGLQAHHVDHWGHGGPTEDANLALVCHRHHQLVHELGWHVDGNPLDPDGLTFYRPDGRPYQPAPAALPPGLHRRYLGLEAA